MPSITRKLIPSIALGVLALGAGCATAPETRTVDAKGPESLNTSGINPQDWAAAADYLVASLLSSNALSRAPRTPAVPSIMRKGGRP